MKGLRKPALIAGALLLLALGAWNRHGIGTGYDFTVDFNTTALGRWTDASIGATFTNPAVTYHYNDDTGTDYVWSVVDASSYPGSHGRALQAKMPYGALGEAIYEGCLSVNAGDVIDFTGGVQIATTVFASSYTSVLTFASTTGVVDGRTVTDLNRDAMFPGTVVSSHTGTTVTLSVPIGKACPSGSFGPDERWAIGLADASTVNVSWQMLMVTGFDFRFIGGKSAPNLNYFLNNGTTYPTASDKLWWKAACVNTFPTTTVCPAIWSAKYQDPSGSPVAQQDFSWNMSTNTWHTFKFQYHRGCPVDQGGCVDHSYINIWGPTSDSDDTQILWLASNPLAAQTNGDTRGYTPSFIMSNWMGGNQPDNACANAAGCAILYDNIRIWSGTGP